MDSKTIKTDQQRQEFEAVTRPVIEWLNANCNPHVTVVIDPTGAELSEVVIAYTADDFLSDLPEIRRAEQWSESELAALKDEWQPAYEFNQIRPSKD